MPSSEKKNPSLSSAEKTHQAVAQAGASPAQGPADRGRERDDEGGGAFGADDRRRSRGRDTCGIALGC